jgi:maltose alpha-D-glucosyltransferase/alpha-amylase
MTMAIETPNLALPQEVAVTAPSAAEDDPLWYKDAIIYQAHVKSLFDYNNDGIGDFLGVTRKLDYIQSLGVSCIWLLPFFPSPLKDDGYDISDYLNVHPQYGTLNDFIGFVQAAHDRHLKVLIELVINHTSDQHPWFQRARYAPSGSPEREFYVWSDTDKKFPETRIIFTDTEKSNWTFDPVAKQYYWHRFFSHQPDLNHNNPAVVDAVIDVMKFWLDLGVDALRLDAVPYLCVREGTSNENLPETHAVLKRIRRELDAAYKNRMLLAEANQWPSDVRDYFGDGDECHMAFHFPLMPRMFMALRQEDRHAITEILSQTPDIPENCQWALFLRNHDELTLEMVTDEERDYMYSVYAEDPQMRLNVGIRRRLAPLLENSRRRIELMNTLLFSMPGTPLIYYGDEIGMGDNIYLGDRNGVRTPMQWSSDRNAGFSRADPARLYAPPIMDPVYGYQAINVEAQERYPFSLLNWMKRLIATRRQHRVFGRGSIEFVGCSNRKVLAYLRRDERETVLVVANLSRALQPAELDLKRFAGLVPVEMGGLSEFPRIGDQPYFLTLGPYAAYWFSLQHEGLHVTQAGARPVAVEATRALADSLPALLVGVEWRNVLDGGTRVVLERQALVPFLERQRWFSSKSRRIQQARFSDWSTIRQGRNPAFVSMVNVDYTDGWTETYVLPLSLLSEDQAARALNDAPAKVLAKITGARKGIIVDGLEDDDVCDRLLSFAGAEQEIASARGSIRGCPLLAPFERPPDRTWTRGSGDQSNSVAFASDRYVLKVFRRIEPGPNPEFEIGRFLADRGYKRTPPLLGALEYNRPSLDPGTIGVVQGFVKHQGSGWEYTIDDLHRYFERVAARIGRSGGRDASSALPAPPALPAYPAAPTPFFNALEHFYLLSAATLGRRTGELHLTLADSKDPAFAPEQLTASRLDAIAAGMTRHATDVLGMLEERLDALSEPTRVQAQAVLAVRHAIVAALDGARSIDRAGFATRIHGDYHLGQVLRVEEDFVIVDFEGEPGRTLAQRRAKHSPLKDVAGMTRSFSYAAYAALFAFAAPAAADYADLEPWADAWQHWATEAFLGGYRAALGSASPLSLSDDAFAALLHTFELEKALYELGYELNNRPDWVRIPLSGILKLAARLQS